MNYSQESSKTYPTEADSLNSERERFDYFMLNLATSYTLIKDKARNRVSSQIELGVNGGINIGSRYKVRRQINGREARIRFAGTPNVNFWRAAVYARITYKFLALWSQYSLTPIFKRDARYTNANGFESKYPEFPKLEFGLSVMF